MQKNTILFASFLLTLTQLSFAQNADSTKPVFHFGGAALVTNNGISLIPTFSLGEPAAIFDIYMGKRKLSFEPEFRFSLEGKPWAFLFWWRYKLVEGQRFKFNIGAHPAMNFRTVTAEVNGEWKEMIVTRRYLAGELSPNYFIAKNVSVGVYYLYSHGIDKEAVRHTHFVTLNSNFSNIRLFDEVYLRFIPQVYYLKQDKEDGFYATSTIALAKRGFPLSVMAIFNKTIETDITASKDFVWNLSLIYSFSKHYVTK